jgi:hypothetical protein
MNTYRGARTLFRHTAVVPGHASLSGASWIKLRALKPFEDWLPVETIFFLVVILIAVWILLGLLLRLKKRTRRKGSNYYVPTFKANFDTWESKWTMDRKLQERWDKARWQQEFNRP